MSNVITLTKALEKLVEENKSKLSHHFETIKANLNIPEFNSEILAKQLKEFENKDRTLKLGIIGRVKAGKSSLLNALVFDGEDILPKAATPMTASLVQLEYGETLRADVEKFDEADIQKMEEKVVEYHQWFKDQENRFFERLKNSEPKKLGQIELSSEREQELRKKAKAQANAIEAPIVLQASFEQSQQIKKGTVCLSDIPTTLVADNIQDLNKQLVDYVGANGKYMPFTKSIHLYLPYPSLKGLNIIDTPGINDPIVSREARTHELLGSCDVVLVVSPSGQFLSRDDISLISRIARGVEGKNIHFVASKVDDQLFGSEKEGLHTPSEVLDRISAKLKTQAENNFQNNTLNEVGGADITQLDNPVICSSSVAYTLLKQFDNQASWDANTQTVWGNLSEYYGDVFNNAEQAKIELAKMASIDQLNNIIETSRENATNTLRVREINAEQAQIKTLQSILKKLNKEVRQEIRDLENTDLKQLEQEQRSLEQEKNRVETNLNAEYARQCQQLISSLSADLNQQITRLLRNLERTANNNRGQETRYEQKTGYREKIETEWETKTEYRKVKRNVVMRGLSWFTGGLINDYDYESYEVRVPISKTIQVPYTYNQEYNVDVIYADRILDALLDTREECVDELESARKEHYQQWQQQLRQSVVNIIKANKLGIDVRTVKNAVERVIHSLPARAFKLSSRIPNSINRTDVIEGKSQIKAYLNDVFQYSAGLQNELESAVQQYSSQIQHSLSTIHFAEMITDTLSASISKKKQDIQDKEKNLAQFNTIQDKLTQLLEEL
ncbi:dynamin family protein [Lonepinella sp. MS14436]|uniref:dynamin family protein n=1 Tax=Lonepinella sp. MS14436 TaxID=3003619 RepID=UPI0036D9EBFA